MLAKALKRATLVHRAWRYRLRVEPDEVRWVVGSLAEGEVAVDVGAYKGGYTFWMRRAVGTSGRVFAFEPQPELAAYLRGCVAAFGWTNVDVEEAALSSERGTRELAVPGTRPSPGASLVGASHSGEALRYEVRLDTLDAFLAERAADVRVRLLKCDVEGHERAVFAGALDTLSQHRPRLLFECEARHLSTGSVDDVFAVLFGLDYDGYFLRQGEPVDVTELDLASLQVEGRRPYVNNFVFVPREELFSP